MRSELINSDQCTVIHSIGIANPPYGLSQNEASELMAQATGISEPLRKRIPQIYQRSAIERRYSCLAGFVQTPADFDYLFPAGSDRSAPSTAARNRLYKQESLSIALSAASRCLDDADVLPSAVTHLIVVSCTGFFAPGLDVLLVGRLGLPSTTRRTMIGFMGCCAAFNGLKSAADICRSEPDARVLLVCVELCSLHVQIKDTLESVVVNSLFADGAAACLISQVRRSETTDKLIYRGSASALESSSLDAMSWEIGDSGFIMGLSPKVPEIIAAGLPGFVEELCRSQRVRAEDIGFWAVHPGGRQILDKTVETLGLLPSALADSYAVLREYGNMSSPTVLFIMQRILKQREVVRDQFGVALAFGPGLTTEGCLLELG